MFQIKCAVKDPGFPPAAMVRWLHNGHEIKGRTDFRLSFNHADVYSSGNYSCVPFNRVGMAQPAATSIRIHSPPTFVQSLPPVSGILLHCTTSTFLQITTSFVLLQVFRFIKRAFSCIVSSNVFRCVTWYGTEIILQFRY